MRVVTDTGADLAPELAAELGVTVVPLSIRFGSEELVDGRDVTPKVFYERMASSHELPQTAAPSPGAFEAAFRALAAEGSSVVCLSLSSDLSGTIDSARAAARALPGFDVRVVDSRSVSWGLGSQVVAAARAASAGASADEVVALGEDMASRTRVYATLDTLDNLRRGGRIGKAEALVGTILSIKPLLDLSTGAVEVAGKVRTRSKALRALVDRVTDAAPVENLAVMHGQADDVDELLALLTAQQPEVSIHVGEIGATIGVHAGRGVIAVTFQVAR